jgi:hypothetical protein
MLKPELRIFPSRDQAFRGEVQAAVDHLTSAATDDEAPDPHDLVSLVHGHYPNVSVTSRDEFGSVGSPRAVWYVFRDKRVRPDNWRRERLYAALARAREVLTDSSMAVGRSKSSISRPAARWKRR